MKAMILAAGLGTRLRPLTDNRPKALVEIAGRTLLEITLSRLRAFGVGEVIINVHHFADMILEYLKTNENFGMDIEISREEVLLDTGGGLKNAAYFFREESSGFDAPFILHNVDVILPHWPCKTGRLLDTCSSTRRSGFAAGDSGAMRKLNWFDPHSRCGRWLFPESMLFLHVFLR